MFGLMPGRLSAIDRKCPAAPQVSMDLEGWVLQEYAAGIRLSPIAYRHSLVIGHLSLVIGLIGHSQ
jgi:hypothetical protein